jgi:Fe(3+) dicitrate transport protein
MEDGVLAAPAPYSAPEAYYSPFLWKYEQIELLKGSAQLISGPQSTGGALNFITPQAKDSANASVRISGGNYGQLRAETQFETPLGKSTTLLAGIARHSATGFQKIGSEVLGGYQLPDGYLKFIHNFGSNNAHQLEWSSGFTQEISEQTYLGTTLEEARDQPGLRYLASELDQMNLERYMNRIGYVFSEKRTLIRIDIYRQFVHRNWYKLNKINAGNGMIGIGEVVLNPLDFPLELMGLKGLLDTAQLEVKGNNRMYVSQGIQFKGHQGYTLFGFNNKIEAGYRLHYDHVDYLQYSDLYDLSAAQFSLQSQGIIGDAGNKRNQTLAHSTYLRNTLFLGPLSLQVGARMEFINAQSTNFGSSNAERQLPYLSKDGHQYFVFLPGGSLSYSNGHWNHFVGLHQGFTPSGTNSNVLPESSLSIEVGTKNCKDGFALTSYATSYARLIGSDAASAGGTGTGELYNGGSAMIQGVEASWEKLWKSLGVAFSGSLTDARFTQDFESKFEGWGNVIAGNPLPYISKYQGSAQVTYAANKTTIALQGQALSSRTSSASLGFNDLPASVLINFSLSQMISPSWQIKLSANNLTNTQHIVAARPAGYRTQAPRMLLLTLSFSR